MDRLKPVQDGNGGMRDFNLHSNMDRLKPPPVKNLSHAPKYLHSNMDRLKLQLLL